MRLSDIYMDLVSTGTTPDDLAAQMSSRLTEKALANISAAMTEHLGPQPDKAFLEVIATVCADPDVIAATSVWAKTLVRIMGAEILAAGERNEN